MVRQKQKGIGAERELIHLFWNTKNWAAIRIAGSGAIKYPVPDVLAANNLRKLAIECKSTKSERQYLTKRQISELNEFALKFGAEPWVGVRYDGYGWRFFSLEDLHETPKGYAANKTHAEIKGLTFDELIGKF